ncbi:MAG: MaoC family dehydratase [Chloroflexi bacterium]|nr:MaoC family dehydratase [Chloroflexota bacterium]
MHPGEGLPTVAKLVTQEQVRRYAEASGDFNPIHLDPAFAQGTPHGRTVAHGMLVLAFISEMLTQAFGLPWLESGRLKVRFKGVVFPGETVTAYGTIKDVKEEAATLNVACTVGCRNGRGEDVMTGEAEMTLPGSFLGGKEP